MIKIITQGFSKDQEEWRIIKFEEEGHRPVFVLEKNQGEHCKNFYEVKISSDFNLLLGIFKRNCLMRTPGNLPRDTLFKRVRECWDVWSDPNYCVGMLRGLEIAGCISETEINDWMVKIVSGGIENE